MQDVVVIGAGPAGSAAANILAKGGQSVTIVDKADFPREKCCGDGLTTLALRELEPLGLMPKMVASWQSVEVANLQSPNGRVVSLPLRHDAGIHAAVATRSELDAALLDRAKDAGANAILGNGLVGITEQPDHLQVELADGRTIKTQHLIAADGIWSKTRKLLDLEPRGYRGEWIAFRQYFEADGPKSRELWVFFEPDLLPGYAWSFPLPNGRVNVGFGVLRSSGISGAETKALWDGLLQRPALRAVLGSDPKPIDRYRALPIPAHIGKAPLSHGRTLFVGDAAALTDPMSGEGIGQALLSGRLAAEAILAGKRESYEKNIRRALMLDYRVSALLSKALSHRRATQGALAAIDLNKWTRRNAGRWLFEDYERAHLFRPSHWGRGAMKGPGAFQPKD